MPNSESTLVSALGELATLGTERDREQVAALLDRLDAARLRVLVVGEAKRGKSTLVNALLAPGRAAVRGDSADRRYDDRPVRRRRAGRGAVSRRARREASAGRAL